MGGNDDSSRSKMIAVILAAAAVVILIGGGAALWGSLHKKDPDAGGIVAQQDHTDPSSDDAGEGLPADETLQENNTPVDETQAEDSVPADETQAEDSVPADEALPDDSEQATDEEPSGDAPAKGYMAAAEMDSPLYYFRPLIQGDGRLLYDTMYELSQIDGTASEKTLYVDTNPADEEFMTAFNTAVDYLHTDHPEFFWRSSFRWEYYSDPEPDGKYKVVFRRDFDVSEYKDEAERLEDAVNDFMSDIDLSRPAPNVALQIHDKLLELAEYDYESYEDGSGDEEGTEPYIYTAYGPLVENHKGESNLAVCAGYSAAYQYLLQRAGIRCIIIQGSAGDSEDDMDSHAWNLVELDGEWYETDCTWDDNVHDSHGDEAEGILAEAISDDWYRNTIDHYLFQVTTDYITYFDPGDDFTYNNENGWAKFLNSSVHIRNDEDDLEETRDYSTLAAPTAEGTKYSYDNIR